MKPLLFGLLGMLLCFGNVSADEQNLHVPEERIVRAPRVSDLIEYAYRNNPMIGAGKESWRQNLEQYRVNTAYPDPQITFTYWPRSVADDLDTKKFEAMISQPIPFPGKLAAAGKASQAEAQISRISLDRAVRDIIIAVRESYYELQYIREAKRISEQNRNLLSRMRTVGETAYAQNRTALIDVTKAQSQLAQNSYDILLLEELEKTEIARLNSLLNRAPDSVIGAIADEDMMPVLYSLEETYGMAQKNREEIRMASAEIGKSEAEADMAAYENYPEFMVGLLYELDAPMQEDGEWEKMFGVQLGMTLPIWWGKNSARIQASKAALRKAGYMATAQENETKAMVREAWFRLQNAERLVILYRDQLIPQAAKSVQIAETWYRQQNGSLSDYIETESVWYNFQLAYARAEADYGKYLARLEGLAGQSLTVRTVAIPR